MFAVLSRFGQIMPMWLRDLRAQEPELGSQMTRAEDIRSGLELGSTLLGFLQARIWWGLRWVAYRGATGRSKSSSSGFQILSTTACHRPETCGRTRPNLT